ncbi:MAG: DUF5677 domain-containing protein [Verrucomicrobiota bacterium]|nr:DUF5677 domain-containing protein [Verrucomicrobiota bacterium]
MDDRTALLSATRKLLVAISKWKDSVSILSWNGSDGYFPILRRSILCRQIDSLGASVDLVASHKGFVGVSLLRPACEELMWLRYFNSLSSSDARVLANGLIKTGMLKDLEAQAGEVGETEMSAMGLHQALVHFRSREHETRKALMELGARLHWPKPTTDKGDVRSAWFIAKAAGSEDLYRFLYHATSRYVHFSPVELARRGWGRPGRLEIGSNRYEPIWAQFTLSWGTRLFVWTLNASLEALSSEGVPEPPYQELQHAINAIAEIPLIPLITSDEMVWNAES